MQLFKSLSLIAIVGAASALPTVEVAAPAGPAARAIRARALTAQAMVDNINNITQQSTNLIPVVQSISSNGLKKRQSQEFQDVISGFQAIINTAQTDITAMQGQAPYTDTTAEQNICDAFSNVMITMNIRSCSVTDCFVQFVEVHQNLLKVLIGKSGLLESIFLGPVAAVLRSLEEVVDTLAFGIIDSVPFCAADATNKKSSLDDTLGKAVCAYTPGGSLGLDLFC